MTLKVKFVLLIGPLLVFTSLFSQDPKCSVTIKKLDKKKHQVEGKVTDMPGGFSKFQYKTKHEFTTEEVEFTEGGELFSKDQGLGIIWMNPPQNREVKVSFVLHTKKNPKKDHYNYKYMVGNVRYEKVCKVVVTK